MAKKELHESLLARNVKDVYAAFVEDPNNVLVSVQLKVEQKDHLNSGMNKRSRRLIPLTLLAKMLKEYAAL